MKTRAFELSKDGRLLETDSTTARHRWHAGDGEFWLDVCEPSPEELELLLADLETGEIIKERLRNVGRTTSVVLLRDAVFAEWAVLYDEDCTRRGNLAALCLPRLLITIRSHAIEPTTEKPEGIDLSELGAVSTATVLCALLFTQASQTSRAARRLRDQIMRLDQRMDDEPGSVEPQDLALLKQQLLLVDAVSEEQRAVFGQLSDSTSKALDVSQIKGSMSLLQSVVGATERLVDRLEGRFLELRHRASDHQQDQLNRRLGVLTVVSTIFLPLTLLAGIWGMNFEYMPELDEPYAYPAAIGLMALIAAGVAWFLRSRGWFE